MGSCTIFKCEAFKWNSMKKLILTLGLFYFTSQVNAEVKPSVATSITAIESYSEYGEGDVIFSIDNPHSSCPRGYWMKKSDPGFHANLSLLLSSFHAQSTVVVRGHDDNIWGGSITTFCHLYSIRIIK